jgi:hypothetical protein
MPNKNYVNGRAFEYKVKKWAEKEMDYTVFRTAGSHGIADLILFPDPNHDKLYTYRPVELVQCKNRAGLKEAPEKVQALVDLAAENKAVACIVRPGKRGSKNPFAIEYLYIPKEFQDTVGWV